MNFDSPTKMYISPTGSKEPNNNEKEPSTDNEEIIQTYPHDFPVTKLPKSITKPGGNPTYTLNAGNFLYRGSAEQGLQIHRLNGIQWYALDLHKIFQYGYPSKYRLKNDLTLLAIDEIDETHPFFTGLDEDMKDKFNIFFTYDVEGNKQRVSIPQNDYDLCEYICSLGYDGYAMNEMKDDSKGDFHAEVALKDGNDKLILIQPINVDNITMNNGDELVDDAGVLINNKWIEGEIRRNNERKEKDERARRKRERRQEERRRVTNSSEPGSSINFSSLSEDSSFRIPMNSYESPPKMPKNDYSNIPNFGYGDETYNSPQKKGKLFGPDTGGKTKKRNRKTKKRNKKKQTKKKNKKSKRKSNKK